MATLWRKAAMFDPAKSSLTTWLYRIARNRRIDLMRRDRSTPLEPDSPVFEIVDPTDVEGELDATQAEAALPLAEDPSGIRRAMLHLAAEDHAAALAALKDKPAEARLLGKYFALRIRANAALGRFAHASVAARDWAAETPNSPAPYRILAEALNAADDPDGAAAAYARAVKISGGASGLVLDYAEFLLARGQADRARDQVAELRAGSDRDERRRQRLLQAC